jgi:hypothetical protein
MEIEKFRQLMFTVSDEILDKLEDFDNRSVRIDPKVKRLQDKLSNYLKDKCYTQFEWLEKHGNVIENPNDFVIKINKRQVDKNKAEKMFVQFHECCNRNDFGIRKYFAKILSDQDNIKLAHTACLKQCQEKTEEFKAKTCVTDCFVNTINKMNSIYDDVNTHLDEYNMKI